MAQQSKRSRIVTWVSGIAALAMIGTIAVVAAGYDARETPREEPSVWAMRSSGQYARVNTLTAEIDTVRTVDDPSGVVQAGAAGVVLTHGNGRAWAIDPMLPQDFVENAANGKDAEADTQKKSKNNKKDAQQAANIQAQADDAEAATASEDASSQAARMPDGTRDVIAAADQLLVRTESGEAYVGTLTAGATDEAVDFSLIDPFAGERAAADESGAEGADAEPLKFTADAAAIDADGRVALLSATEHEVRWYSVARGEFTDTERISEDITAEDLQLAIVDGSWVALNGQNLWRAGAKEPVTLALDATPKLQASSLKGDGTGVLVADGEGLWRVTDDEATNLAKAQGLPAQPVTVAGKQYAAWIGQGGASLWQGDGNSDGEGTGKVTELAVDDSVKMPGDPDPVFRTNGSATLLSEVKTGMLWTVPEGRLIPVEQWTLADPPKERDGTIVVADVTEQEPPVAVDDAFGVRATETAALPVLLNDYDPNRKDVLTIVPEGLAKGLDKKFGEISLTPDEQNLVFTPGAAAQGSASFSYRITDGVNTSEPATVTLQVVADSVNTAPEWCPVDGCQREWPSPELAPGGTLVLPILESWVDPEGDPIMLESATPVNDEDPVRALVTADGRLAVRHLDANADGGEVAVRLRVADAHGKVTKRDLVVQVRSNAKVELNPIATTVEIDQPVTVQPLTRVTGGSGSYTLVDANVQSGAAKVTIGASGGIRVNADQAGQTLVALTVRDLGTKQEATGLLRITSVPTHAKLGLPPLRAFVRPLADTTVDVLTVVPGGNSRALVVQSAQVTDGEMRADVIEYANVRVSGSTADGAPGRIGSADITVAEGADTAVGRLTVFQVAEQNDTGAIAVADNATVRAGAVADIAVLDNDVSAPGERLVLHPEITGSGAKGELAFASGNTLRYLAPKEPGTYTLSYTTYGASSPQASDVGQVQITVVARDANREPTPPALTVRLAPGDSGVVQVPLSGVDPDGDRVRLVGVDAPKDAQLTATISARSSSVRVEASVKAEAGTQAVNYEVRDEFGGAATGTLRIIVTDDDSGAGAPIAYSDYVRLVSGAGEPAVVQPLENDIDPAGGKLSLVDVVPNVAGGENSPEYRKLAARLDTSELKKGRIKVTGSAEPGTVSFRYKVRSSESLSTADGLIVVQVSARVGQQAPTVRDTVLSARDRAELEGGGVDVVTDRVIWATGDTSTLKLSVWGSAAKKFTANGNHISGAYSAKGDLVPFKLTGTDVTGTKVETFGFLVIPPLDELRLTLVPGLAPIKVDEDNTREVGLAELVDLGVGDTAEFNVGRFATQRGQAACEATTSTTLRYTAGKGEPWIDSCLISVKLADQNTWTQLSVPVQIAPKEPIAELEALTRTVAPGATETVNLMDMVKWHGEREGTPANLQFAVSGGGHSFEIVTSGQQVSVQARADAVPGAEDATTVTVTGAGDSQAPLVLRVGEAAKDTPRGATVQLSCTVGSSCQTQLIGAPGEYDPFAGKSGGGLKLDALDGAACAAFGTLQVAGDGASLAWANDKVPGGTCTATFTVRDAQNRIGSGSIELDVRGIPAAPSNISWVDSDESSVKFSVTLGSGQSYPAVTGVELVTGGGTPVGSCSLGSTVATCTVSNLTPGEKRTYQARATNDVGVSEVSASGAEAWAYVPPAAPKLTASTMTWADNTDSTRGKVKLNIGDAPGVSIRLFFDDNETPVAGNGEYVLSAGTSHSFRVIVADALIPDNYSGSKRDSTSTASVTPIGAPEAGSATITAKGDRLTEWEFATPGWKANGGGELKMTYGMDLAGASQECTGSKESGHGLKANETYAGFVCASTEYGRTGVVSAGEIFTGVKLDQLNGTYQVSAKGSQISATSYAWAMKGDPKWSPNADGDVTYSQPTAGSPTVGDVVQCPAGKPGSPNCSNPGTLSPASLAPFELSFTASVPLEWANYDTPPTGQEIRAAFSWVGEPGGTLEFTRVSDTSNSVIVSWQNGERQSVEFRNVVNDRPDKPEPTTDPEGTSDSSGTTGSSGTSDSTGTGTDAADGTGTDAADGTATTAADGTDADAGSGAA